MIIKRILSLQISIILALSAYAVVATPEPIVVTQPDGSQKTVFLHGDEHFHYLTDDKGNWLKEKADGVFEQIEPLSVEQIRSIRHASDLRKVSPFRKAQTEWSNNLVPRGLVILVNFSDISFDATNTPSSMREMYMGTNYTYNGATGSVRQYFIDQSMKYCLTEPVAPL